MKILESLRKRSILLRQKPGPTAVEIKRLAYLKTRYLKRSRDRFGRLFRDARLAGLRLYKFGDRRYIQAEGPGYQINIILRDFGSWIRDGRWIGTNLVFESPRDLDLPEPLITGSRSLVRWIRTVRKGLL